ncbi:MAG: hypothetical protein WB902_24305, partial [Acetobacteraceae bacterium]
MGRPFGCAVLKGGEGAATVLDNLHEERLLVVIADPKAALPLPASSRQAAVWLAGEAPGRKSGLRNLVHRVVADGLR